MAWKRDLMMMLMTGMAAAGGQDSLTGSNPTTPLPALAIRFIDYVGIETGAFVQFRDLAAAALRTGGIESVWVHCQGTPGSMRPARCEGPLLDTEVILMLRPEACRRQKEAMGSSLTTKDGQGLYAWLYLPKIERTARLSEVPVAGLMALAAVHEIGHLLAGPEHHASGLMQADWSGRQIHLLLNRDGMRFHPWVAKKLQAGLAARTNQAVAQAR